MGEWRHAPETTSPREDGGSSPSERTDSAREYPGTSSRLVEEGGWERAREKLRAVKFAVNETTLRPGRRTRTATTRVQQASADVTPGKHEWAKPAADREARSVRRESHSWVRWNGWVRLCSGDWCQKMSGVLSGRVANSLSPIFDGRASNDRWKKRVSAKFNHW